MVCFPINTSTQSHLFNNFTAVDNRHLTASYDREIIVRSVIMRPIIIIIIIKYIYIYSARSHNAANAVLAC